MGFPIGTNQGEFALELRVKFPGPSDSTMAPTKLSGALMTLSNGGTPAFNLALWYEKPALTSMTGNLYVTSSAGRVTMVSASIFDDNFYNLAVVKERTTGSLSIYAMRYEDDELTFSSSSVALTGAVGYSLDGTYTTIDIGSSTAMNVPSQGEFWAQEFRAWDSPLRSEEIAAHADHFESYGRNASYDNNKLQIHWRLNDGVPASASGTFLVVDSTPNSLYGSGSSFVANLNPFDKFLLDYAYIPGIDYGWNQEKVRVFSGSTIDPQDAYRDERFVSLEFNMYDALNEDISHVMTSYEELNSFLGLPVNKYREDYEGLRQMRETYFKRLQGPVNFRVFVDMLDFFDSSFVSIVERLIPTRTLFKGDELVVESHMLERPKYQYQLRPVVEGRIDISGSIAVVDYGSDFD